jgi:hypothetical protein
MNWRKRRGFAATERLEGGYQGRFGTHEGTCSLGALGMPSGSYKATFYLRRCFSPPCCRTRQRSTVADRPKKSLLPTGAKGQFALRGRYIVGSECGIPRIGTWTAQKDRGHDLRHNNSFAEHCVDDDSGLPPENILPIFHIYGT